MWIGVDPGVHGGIGVVGGPCGDEVFSFFNRTNAEIADEFIRIGELASKPPAILEMVHSMPKDSAKAAFEFGKNTGILIGIIAASRCFSYFEVPPQTWQKKLGLIFPKMDRTKKKRLHREMAQRLFPGLAITNDTADAILIAHYCRLVR